jgi:hypothetical protein
MHIWINSYFNSRYRKFTIIYVKCPIFYDFSRSVKIKKKISILFVTVRELDGRRSDAPVSVGLCVCELPEQASHARGMGPTYPPVQTVLHDPLKETVPRDLCPLICFISSLE